MHLVKVGALCLLFMFLLTGASARIVFSSIRDGVQGVYVMDDDGSNQTLLTESEELEPYPNSWSPDGKHILFKSRVKWNGRSVLFLMNPDGTNIQQLTPDDDRYIGKCSFSPDGNSIVFDTYVRIGNHDKGRITVLNIETGKMKKIAEIDASFCDWSPDGKHIIFSKPLAVGGGGNTIWIMSADGHNQHPLVPEPAAGGVVIHRWAPRWSPNGQKIVFTQDEYVWEKIEGLGTALIYKAHRYIICNLNGENIKRLQIPKEWRPVNTIDWMDDGKSVVFSAYDGIPLNKPILRDFVFPPANIYKYHIETHVITQLTNHPGKDSSLDWISDDVLSVTPQSKKKVTWGKLKQSNRNR